MVVASSSASTLRLMEFILQKSAQLFGHFVGKVKVPISHVFESKDQSLGTSWYTLRRKNKKPKNKDCGVECGVCSQIIPTFCELSGKFLKVSFVYADIDECPETTQHIRYTPTFHFYRDGERVDEMFGVGEERLQDRLWLHS